MKLLTSILLLASLTASAQSTIPTNVYNRPGTSLAGEWQYIVDPYENGYYNYRYQAFDQSENPSRSAYFMNAKPKDKTELIEYDFDKSETIQVPGDWNAQKENLFYYEGTLWYKKSFDFAKQKADNKVFVHFGAANYQSDVYLNGKKLGTHLGGFTPFGFEITDLIVEKGNFLVVKVDNKRKKEGVPTLNTDWWNYGGITRDVKIVELPSTYISDYMIQLDKADNQMIKGFVKLQGQGPTAQKITVEIPELKIRQELTTDDLGLASFNIKSKKINYWSTDNPKLYEVKITAAEDVTTDQIGFRTISTKGHDILLNGQPIFLRGISIHEENPFRGGRAHSRDDAKQLLTWAKELGCNMVRLAHYPHAENMARLADEMGMLVWEENPVYWTIQWENPATFANAENQLTEVISRDKNRASVIIWSMANETPRSDARTAFLTRLASKARELDGTRLISAALEQSTAEDDAFTMMIDDPFAEVVDILSFNQYVGWYNGLPDKCRKIRWNITQDKPVFISEFGAGAKYGHHGDSLTRWTEEYQEWLYKETLDMLGTIPQLRGMSPWILVDFRSPRRHLPEIQDGWNRKGLLSDKGEKKKAYFVLQEYYKSK